MNRQQTHNKLTQQKPKKIVAVYFFDCQNWRNIQ